MTLSDLFKKLGAPLKSARWSWGSVRASDGTLFLRVWQDDCRRDNGKDIVWLSDTSEDDSSQGAVERREHVALIQAGNPCFLVMCLARDTKALPRVIKSFNEKELFSTGELHTDEKGAWWIERGPRIAFAELLPKAG
ncbi:hypothetical protein [Dyella silvatica]|uniref:hypothetical protein n=1 Tax=Dyella silvatica TaxID=2992128 RepID=UPI0022540D93|nr:hypothetical protein [Dyella silvatica]